VTVVYTEDLNDEQEILGVRISHPFATALPRLVPLGSNAFGAGDIRIY
jgi:hypothetical protein